MKFIDTHSHIYYDKFNHDFKDVILRAKENNISNIVCVGVDLDSSKKSIEIAEQNDFIYATVGYHPHESKDVTENYLYEIEELIKHPKVVAVGEMGLDFYYNHSDKEIQIDVFEKQLKEMEARVASYKSSYEYLKSTIYKRKFFGGFGSL